MHLTFDSYEELRLLHLALCEARFHPDPEQRGIQGSPVSASTAEKVYDLLVARAPDEKTADGWRLHRELNRNSHLIPVIENFARHLVGDSSLNLSEKKEALKVFAAPFQLPDHLIEDILERIGDHRPTLW